MKQLCGIIRYEYRMSITRWSFWIAFGLVFLPYLGSLFSASQILWPVVHSEAQLWTEIARFALKLNLFMPVIGGILLSDRLVRDDSLGLDELLRSSGVTPGARILGKYFGGLFSILTPVGLIFLGTVLSLILGGKTSWLAIWVAFLAFLGIILPAYAFLSAFSLACPLFMPVRVYQILFTGYWVWGNFLDPALVPTLNGTLFTANGEFVLAGFFGGQVRLDPTHLHTPQDALLNLAVLAICTILALGLVGFIMTNRERRA